MKQTVRTLAAVELGGTEIMITPGASCENHAPPLCPASLAPDAALENLAVGGADFAAISVASFGPLELNPRAPDYGKLRNAPRPDWAGFDPVGRLCRAFGVLVILETDVNAAGLGEGGRGASGCTDFAHNTVGTAVGVGIVTAGPPVHGAGHREAGHVLVRQCRDYAVRGACFARGACIEGLINRAALQAHAGGGVCRPDGAHWDMARDYLARFCMSVVRIGAPRRIGLRGGVGARLESLAAAGRRLLWHLADRYRQQAEIDVLRVPARLELSGVVGGFDLADGRARNLA